MHLRPKVLVAEVMFEYNPQHVGDLALAVGDKVEVTRKGDDGWWMGTLRGATGNFPGKKGHEQHIQVGHLHTVANDASTSPKEMSNKKCNF